MINPEVVNELTEYNLTKNIVVGERGQSPEAKAAEEEKREKGRKANDLMNNFMNVEVGTYSWNGSNWVLEK